MQFLSTSKTLKNGVRFSLEIVQTDTNRLNTIYRHASFSAKFGLNQNADCVGKEQFFLLNEVIK